MTSFAHNFVYFLPNMLSRLAVNHSLVTPAVSSTSARYMKTRELLYQLLAPLRWNGSYLIKIIVREKVEVWIWFICCEWLMWGERQMAPNWTRIKTVVYRFGLVVMIHQNIKVLPQIINYEKNVWSVVINSCMAITCWIIRNLDHQFKSAKYKMKMPW